MNNWLNSANKGIKRIAKGEIREDEFKPLPEHEKGQSALLTDTNIAINRFISRVLGFTAGSE